MMESHATVCGSMRKSKGLPLYESSMFHKSFKNEPGNVVHQTDEEDPSDSECEDEPVVSITEEDNEPACPGMEQC